MTEVQNLEVLEQSAERALDKAETGWLEFEAAMRAIRQSGAHQDANYSSFEAYYRDRWQQRAGRTMSAVYATAQAAASIEAMQAFVEVHRDEATQMPSQNPARILRTEFPDVEERVGAWEHHLESGRKMGANREGLQQSIREYKGTGVIERGEEAGVQFPPYPDGPSDEEVAYRKLSDLAAVAKDVTPEAAARAVSSSTAYSVAPNYDFLLPWVRSFLAELHIRAGR